MIIQLASLVLVLSSCGMMYPSFALQEAPDGSVCFNGCNGHGDCIDYSCHCHVGYTGDDCGVTFADEGNILPIMSVGDFNLTKKGFSKAIKKHNTILVEFSSPGCMKCIRSELEYVKVHEALRNMKIPFARANVDKLKTISLNYGATELPAIVLFQKTKPLLFRGAHAVDSIIGFVKKQLAPPCQELSSVDMVTDFMQSRADPKYSLSTVMVIGFFSDHEEIEEDDYEDYIEVATEMKTLDDIYFAAVVNEDVARHFIKKKVIDRTPSYLLVDDRGDIQTINANELNDGEQGALSIASIADWIRHKSVPTVGHLTPANFQLYEKTGKPMLMLFLDMTNAAATSDPVRVVGGRSGGVLNEVLLEEFRAVAKEHVDRISFVYLDGNKHQDQMRSLGLYGGAERLPSLAFNTKDKKQIPFSEKLAINKETLTQFCADFISGKLQSAKDAEELAKKQLQAARPISSKNTLKRKPKKKAPEQVRGVSEQFGDGARGDNAVVVVTSKNFDEVVMDETKDVLIMFHSVACEPCSHFSVYYKRMAQRFQDLQISSLIVARMDVSNESPPGDLNMLVTDLPLLILVPANDKTAPWLYYSGVSKVQTMMKWVEQYVSIPFELPNLPHLSESDVKLYKEQVREREEHLEEKRQKDEEAMKAEAFKQEQFKQKIKREEEEAAAVNIASRDNDDAEL